MAASSTAIRRPQSRRPITGRLHATRGRATPTGFLSRPGAIERTSSRGQAWLRRLTAFGVLAVLATGLGRDHGPARFSLSAVGFEQLQGWPEDRLTPAIAAFVKSCTRLRALADNSPIDTHTSVDFGRVGNWRECARPPSRYHLMRP